MSRVSPFLWFDDQAEQAAELYTSLIPGSRILDVRRYPEGSPPPATAGSVMSVTFELDGLRVQDVDRLWDGLIAGGGEPSQCGWLKDRFGLSWQIVPRVLDTLLQDPDPARAGRAMQAMLGMQKLDVAALLAAADG
jgi:predicted 3-demethylubiquinone-9 3-methyltransferase (glyoxalase superfamily)